MSKQLASDRKPERWLSGGKLLQWTTGFLCFGVLVFIVMQMVIQFYTPAPAHRIQILQDVPLPGPFFDEKHKTADPLLPGAAERFDHFDFQALDPQTHLLFLAHSGPNPDKEQTINAHFNPDKDGKFDGNIIVFDLLQKRLRARLDIPQVTGMVIAPDLGRVYAADTLENIVFSIDEKTLKATPIKLDDNEGPDGIAYDSINHKIYVADPGVPSDPAGLVINPKNQNISVIDTLTNTVTKINLAIDKPWGDDVGHVRFDPVSGRIFVVTLPLSDPHNPNPNPAKLAYLAVIDPVSEKIITRIQLPGECLTPHGLAIDSQQQEAFVACLDSDPNPLLVRVDLRTLKPIQETFQTLPVRPDILVIDHSLHLLYVGAATGFRVFDESAGRIKETTDFQPGINMHTLSIDESTHTIYAPLTSVGGRPVLRILQYNSRGA